VHEAVEEYFSFVRRFPCSVSCVRAHLFRLWAHALTVGMAFIFNGLAMIGINSSGVVRYDCLKAAVK